MARSRRSIPKSPVPRSSHEPTALEWVGGRLLLPMYVGEEKPQRPQILLWMELPSGLIVGAQVIDPTMPATALVESLLVALERPMAGPLRTPARIRVADGTEAMRIHQVVGGVVEVVHAPTPELNGLLELMARQIPVEAFGDDDAVPASYLEQGRVSEEAVAHLFQSAKKLHGRAPWKVASDSDVLHFTVEELGAREMVISVIGGLGQSLGLILFESVKAFHTFVANLEERGAPGSDQAPLDFGSSPLALDLNTAAEMPKSMRDEAKKHRWPLPARGIYPMVVRRDPDGTPRPLEERDVRLCAVAGAAVSHFFERHEALFRDEPRLFPVEVATETVVDEHQGRRWTARRRSARASRSAKVAIGRSRLAQRASPMP